MRPARAFRPALAVALVLTGVAMPAFAKSAPKPVCNIITDAEGDAHRRPLPAVSQVTIFESPALDILSADIASGAKTVSVVIRMKTTDVSTDPYAPLGYAWSFTFKIGPNQYAVQRKRAVSSSGSATYTDTLSSDGTPGALPAGTKVAMDGTSYSWVLPRGAFPGLKKKHVSFSNLQVTAAVGGSNADAAGALKPYADRTPSCLKPA
jgi:hypothetical protein